MYVILSGYSEDLHGKQLLRSPSRQLLWRSCSCRWLIDETPRRRLLPESGPLSYIPKRNLLRIPRVRGAGMIPKVAFTPSLARRGVTGTIAGMAAIEATAVTLEHTDLVINTSPNIFSRQPFYCRKHCIVQLPSGCQPRNGRQRLRAKAVRRYARITHIQNSGRCTRELALVPGSYTDPNFFVI